MIHPAPWVKPFLIPTDNPPSTGSPKPEATALETETKKKEPKGAPSGSPAPLYPVLQGGTPEEFIFPPPPYNLPPAPQPAPLVLVSLPRQEPPSGLAQRTQNHQEASPSGEPEADAMVLPLWATETPDANGNQPHHYWPFDTSVIYSWRTQNAKFTDNPRDLIDLFKTVLFLPTSPLGMIVSSFCRFCLLLKSTDISFQKRTKMSQTLQESQPQIKPILMITFPIKGPIGITTPLQVGNIS